MPLLDVVRRSAEQAGRDPAKVELILGCPGALPKSGTDPRAAVEERIARGAGRVALPITAFMPDLETTLAVIGGRWKVLILQQLFDGVRRFNELHRALASVTHKTLTQQLRELEADGIIARKVFAQIPPKVEYSLTEQGWSSEPVLRQINAWGEQIGLGF